MLRKDADILSEYFKRKVSSDDSRLCGKNFVSSMFFNKIFMNKLTVNFSFIICFSLSDN